MKRFITDLYKIIYQLTGYKTLSIGLAIVYLSALNLLTLYGLIFLLKGLVKVTALLKLFAFPYYLITIVAMLAFNYWLLTPLKDLSKGKRIKPLVAPIIVYSLVAILLFLYGRYFETINF
ncbi:MAG: hypothetical protein K0Q79_234 [Flavipsychrobacter sp.]|jgi:hypothetical protein|nr:hypothetical protein [Flavipsychrobacter sp.]